MSSVPGAPAAEQPAAVAAAAAAGAAGKSRPGPPPAVASDPAPAPPEVGTPTASEGGGTSSAVFVSYSERREHVSNKGGRKTGGHVYQIRFFLVDATGMEHLAAVGEDQGDAHYIYSNQPGFPGLFGHNKQDVKRWLEDVMAASQLRAGYHLDLVQDEVPTDPSAIRLPTFVAYRHERTELEDGRHAMRWFLVDVFGKEHVAIAGEEKDTRDGHYDYSTQGIFHMVAPLSCHNQSAVVRWLDEHVVHKGQAAAAATGKLPGNIHASGGHGRAGGAKAGRKAGSDLARAAALRKWKVSGAGGGGDAGTEAREALAAELRGWAREEAGARAAARRRALTYVTDPAPAEGLRAAEECMAALATLGSRGGRATGQDDRTRQEARLLGVLRELAHSYAPLTLAALPGLQAALAQARDKQPTPEVAELAGWILDAWARALACHLAVLSQARYTRDPVAELEGVLATRRSWLDAATAAVTHRPRNSDAAAAAVAARGALPPAAAKGDPSAAPAAPAPGSTGDGGAALEGEDGEEMDVDD